MTPKFADLVRLDDGRYVVKYYPDETAWQVSEGATWAVGKAVAFLIDGELTPAHLALELDPVLIQLLFDTAEVLREEQ